VLTVLFVGVFSIWFALSSLAERRDPRINDVYAVVLARQSSNGEVVSKVTFDTQAQETYRGRIQLGWLDVWSLRRLYRSGEDISQIIKDSGLRSVTGESMTAGERPRYKLFPVVFTDYATALVYVEMSQGPKSGWGRWYELKYISDKKWEVESIDEVFVVYGAKPGYLIEGIS